MSSKISSRTKVKRTKNNREEAKFDKAMSDIKKIGILSCCIVGVLLIVSLFIDPEKNQVEASAKTGAQFIEMHTGSYSEAYGTPNEETEFQKLKNASELAQKLGLRVNAGHGLNYENVHRMHEIHGLYELNIGHSIISRAVFTGLPEAVRKMAEMIR